MSADSGPVQTPMPGFLSLLNLKNKGLLPDLLRGNIQPVIDVEPSYRQGTLTNIDVAVVRAAIGIAAYNSFVGYSPVPLVVPENEIWFVENYSASISGAGTVDDFGLGYQLVGGVNPNFFFDQRTQLTATRSGAVLSARGFFLPSGAIVGFWLGTVAGAVANVAVTGFRYARLRV